MNILYLDTETTGVDRETMSIIEYGTVEQEYHEDTLRMTGDTAVFTKRFKPREECSFEAMGVHNITSAMVADKPDISEDDYLLQAISDADYIVGHNAEFDISVILREVFNGDTTPFQNHLGKGKIICTLRLAKHAWNDLPSYRLAALRYRFNLSVIDGESHAADFDAYLCRGLIELIAKELKIDTWPGLMKKMQEPLIIHLMYFGKHRGMEVSEMFCNHPDYIKWLARQPWFSKEHPDLEYTINVLRKK